MSHSNLFTALSIVMYSLGFVCAVFALWRSRTAQGATAWIIGLIGFPYLMVPLFVIFGRNKFLGYVKQRRELDQLARKEMGEIRHLDRETVKPPARLAAIAASAKLARQPGFMDDNTIDLLIDGEETFGSMLDAIRSAKSYILFQFYIIRPDEIGNAFADALVLKAKEGVQVRVLFDALGTSLHKKYLERLRASGVHACRFSSTKLWSGNIQINFRNHRKLLVVDGQCAFVGGFNIGDDYLGKYPKVGPWRDTHVKISGPCAVTAQLSFVKDWYWATEEMLDLNWEIEPIANGCKALILHTGPADDGEAALLAHIALVHTAEKRLWIANPYVVPPEGLANALGLAVLRGVDVRLLTPSKTDNMFVKFASETTAEKLMPLGVRYFKYEPGFLHQKVMLIDDDVAAVGSVNLDSRSLFVNFEVQAISPDRQFVSEVEAMLTKDFARSTEWTLEDLKKRPFYRQVVARAVTLISPVL